MRRWFPPWAVIVLIGFSIGTVWLRLSFIGASYSIDQSDRVIRELQEQKEKTELRVTALRSPRRLEILARTRFGLSHPKAEQIIHIRGEESGI